MFNSDFGILNEFLKGIGIMGPAWLADELWAMPAMIINGIWGALGFNMLLYLAALKAIPDNHYKAAMIDGANAWHRFRYITLPGVSPTTFFILVTSIIGAMQDFSRFMILTGGGPGEYTTTTIMYYIWLNAFRYSNMGYAAAMSWMLGVMICIITVINFKYADRWVHYN
jgi:multiple sugar transport system permease protein